MSSVVELFIGVAATFAVVWLPGAVVITAAKWRRRPRAKRPYTSYPAGPAMDLF